MQWLVDLMNSPNGTFLICFAGFAVIAGVILSRKGLLSVHTKAVSLGIADRERDIIRQQQRFAFNYLMGLEPFFRDMGGDDYDENLTWKCLERAYDNVVEWITLNHICVNEYYVSNKQNELTSLMYSQGLKPQYRTPEFKEQMNAWIEYLVRELYYIRKNYSNSLAEV